MLLLYLRKAILRRTRPHATRSGCFRQREADAARKCSTGMSLMSLILSLRGIPAPSCAAGGRGGVLIGDLVDESQRI